MLRRLPIAVSRVKKWIKSKRSGAKLQYFSIRYKHSLSKGKFIFLVMHNKPDFLRFSKLRSDESGKLEDVHSPFENIRIKRRSNGQYIAATTVTYEKSLKHEFGHVRQLIFWDRWHAKIGFKPESFTTLSALEDGVLCGMGFGQAFENKSFERQKSMAALVREVEKKGAMGGYGIIIGEQLVKLFPDKKKFFRVLTKLYRDPKMNSVLRRLNTPGIGESKEEVIKIIEYFIHHQEKRAA